jgi:hypothetical protein
VAEGPVAGHVGYRTPGEQPAGVVFFPVRLGELMDGVDLSPFLVSTYGFGPQFHSSGPSERHFWSGRYETRRSWLRAWVRWRARRPRPEGRRYREFQTVLWRWRKTRPRYRPNPDPAPVQVQPVARYRSWDGL